MELGMITLIIESFWEDRSAVDHDVVLMWNFYTDWMEKDRFRIANDVRRDVGDCFLS